MIQVFVVVAVALGIASVLGVSVIQKSREIGILKATGTSTGAVLRIFLLEGAIVGARRLRCSAARSAPRCRGGFAAAGEEPRRRARSSRWS